MRFARSGARRGSLSSLRALGSANPHLMRLHWSRAGIPHGYLCATRRSTPSTAAAGLRGCLPEGPLRLVVEEFGEQLAVDRGHFAHDTARIQQLQGEFELRYDE